MRGIFKRYETESAIRRVRIEDTPSKYGGTYERRIVEIKCCGEWLECDRFTNTCSHCHADYNMSGDRLAPREQWGEETGEHWVDIVNLPY